MADRRTLTGDATAAGTVVMARSAGAVVLEVDTAPGESPVARAVRDFGLVRRHRTLTLKARESTLTGPTPLLRPAALPVTVAVEAAVLDADDEYVLVSVGTDPVHRMVPRELVADIHDGVCTMQCKVDVARLPLQVDVPGVPVEGPVLAQLSFVRGHADASRLRATARPAAGAGR